MSRILLFILVFHTLLVAQETLQPPQSAHASEGKSVYVAPAPSVDVVEEGCVQKEDQNVSGYGNAK